jgi:hypothetical protein
LPALSKAVTVMVFHQRFNEIPDACQFFMPLQMPLSPRELRQTTFAIPALSVAVPPTVILDVLEKNDDLVVGDIILTAGASASCAL